MQKIYHYHLKKCGGTTMAAWLDTLSSAERTYNPAWEKNWSDTWHFPRPDDPPQNSGIGVARSIFHWSDVVSEHATLRQFVPPDTFCFTILRDPIHRIISQVTDWRRLTQADLTTTKPLIRDCVLDSQQLPIKDFLVRHGHGTGKMVFDNFMTRALAATRLGHAVLGVKKASDLLEDALFSLHTDYDFVGIAEEFDLSRNALCALLGLPPAGVSLILNKSAPDGWTSDNTLTISDEDIETYTGCDRILYDAARALFTARYRALGDAYDTYAFEHNHATTLLSGLRGVYANGATHYSVRDPFYGSGFHGRDGKWTGAPAVWTGPQARSVLYIPTPEYMKLSLLLWVRGYAADGQRESLRISINGVPTPHRFESMQGYADLVAVDTFTTAPFARVEIEVGETATTGEPGTPHFDRRKRAISFDAYGWRPV
jgi:hypothetical protein